jgi:hypothetical protein
LEQPIREETVAVLKETLRQIKEEPSAISRPVQEALSEIAAGDTTVVYSTEELEEHLRGSEPSD